MSAADSELKLSRAQDCKFVVWCNKQESICQVLTPNWVVPRDVKKRSSTTDLDAYSTEIGYCSKSSRIIQSFKTFRANNDAADGQELVQRPSPLTPEPAARSAGDQFEVENSRYHDVGLLLGESNYPCSKNERADIDLALVFKYTHFT